MRAVVLALTILTCPIVAAAQAREIHGENSSFAGEGVALAWGILKAQVEDQSQVVIRIAPLGEAYASVSIEGIDPFTQKRQEILGGSALGQALDVRSGRGSFAELPGREIHLFTVADWQARRPTLTVFFMGVPDTTPEFLSENALATYLAETLSKLQASGRGYRP